VPVGRPLMDRGLGPPTRACPGTCASGLARGARPGILPPLGGERGRTPPPSFAACLRPFFPGLATGCTPRPRLREFRARRRIRRDWEPKSAVARPDWMDPHGRGRDRSVPARLDLAGGRPPARHAKCDELCTGHPPRRRFHPGGGRRASDGRKCAAARGCRGRGPPGRQNWDGRGRVRLGRLVVRRRGMDRSSGRTDGPGGSCGSCHGWRRRMARSGHVGRLGRPPALPTGPVGVRPEPDGAPGRDDRRAVPRCGRSPLTEAARFHALDDRGRRVHVPERTDRLRPRGGGRTRRACPGPAGRLARRRRRR